MHSLFFERAKSYSAFDVADIQTVKTSSYHDMKDFRRVAAVVTTGTVTIAKTVTVEIMKAKDDQGTGAVVFETKAVTVTENSTVKIDIEKAAEFLSYDEADGADYTHVALRAVSDNGAALNASAVLLFVEPRYVPVD